MDKRVSAVVRISEFNESPYEAINSILTNREFFHDVHLVKFGYSTHEELYPSWPEHLRLLRAANLDPTWHSELDISKIGTQLIMWIEPDLDVKDGAIRLLLDNVEKKPHCENFAVTSATSILQPSGHDARLFIEGIFTYGFLLVIHVLDTLRGVITGFQQYRTTDLRAQLVLETYPKRRRLASDWSFLWWFGNGISTSSFGGNACVQAPAEKDQGFIFLLRTIKTHRGMGFGLWIIGYLMYYSLFAYPFWNVLISKNFFLAAWLVRDLSSMFWIWAHIMHMVLVCYVYHLKLDVPYLVFIPLVLAGYFIFLTASPLLFLFARFNVAKPKRVLQHPQQQQQIVEQQPMEQPQ